MNNHKTAIIIPAHNEASVIKATLQSLSKLGLLQQTYVVDDGSSDLTGVIAQKYTKNVAIRKTNHGKAEAINFAIARWKLTSKYAYIMPQLYS